MPSTLCLQFNGRDLKGGWKPYKGLIVRFELMPGMQPVEFYNVHAIRLGHCKSELFTHTNALLETWTGIEIVVTEEWSTGVARVARWLSLATWRCRMTFVLHL